MMLEKKFFDFFFVPHVPQGHESEKWKSVKEAFFWVIRIEIGQKRSDREKTNAVFTILMAAIIAISIKMVGILLITGMLIIPAAMARNLANNPKQMIIISIIGGLLAVVLGLYSSLEFNTASGPSIITAALVLFILSMFNIRKFKQLKK